MNSLESQRRKTANIVIALAKLAEDHDDLLNLLDAKFGDLEFLSEEGCFRQVFALPNKLVLKLCPRDEGATPAEHHRHNLVEFRMAKRFPDLVTKAYGRYRKGDVDVLVSERVTNVGSYHFSRRSRRIYRKFKDASGANLGWRGNKLVLLDAGCGLR